MSNKVERRQGWPPFLPDLLDWVETVPGFRTPGGLHGIRVEEQVSGDAYVVKAELPGIDPDQDVEITAEGDLLTIRAERTERAEDKHRSEFRYGTFTRTVRLPTGARPDEAEAAYGNGVLTVKVPVAEAKAAAKTIQVKRETP